MSLKKCINKYKKRIRRKKATHCINSHIGCIFLFSALLCCLFPFIFAREAFCDDLFFSKTGQIGDTIGGTMGPFIAILAAWLTYMVFKSQVDFQKWQDFDSKFYKLLDFHKQNVSQLSVMSYQNGKIVRLKAFECFHELCNEIRLLNILYDYYKENVKHNEIDAPYQNDVKVQEREMIFEIFYFGLNDLANNIESTGHYKIFCVNGKYGIQVRVSYFLFYTFAK